ncbi:DUF3021 family protein [Atopobium fossor]|uniref:DUF3021 family protein n=1 Tax=Atopobium fossor TaxID=39487 RepID=UPI0006842917|nr:DUF3021 family protein [Atopobium fossor]
MNLKTKVIKNGFFRGLITLGIMGCITYFSEATQQQSLMSATIISTAIAAASIIYDYDVWSVKKKIIVHTIMMLFTVYPALVISGWFDTSHWTGYLIILGSFAACGCTFASIGYVISRYILKNVPVKIRMTSFNLLLMPFQTPVFISHKTQLQS